MAALVVALAGCPPQNPNGGVCQPGGPNSCGQNQTGIAPEACGKIDVTPAGRKLYAFLLASNDLDLASKELENSVYSSCSKMATLLGVPPARDTKTLCGQVADALKANLSVSVKSESRLVTKYTPAECHTDVSFTAGVVAQCEGHAVADPMGADVSAECRASADIRTSMHTTCTEPKVEVVRENVTVVDDTKFQAAVAAINAGMPTLLASEKKLELAAQALANWASTGASLVDASASLIADLGEKGVCVASQVAAVAAASTQIQARFSVSIEVTASVSASAGATPR
jgi:ribosomal protein S16